MKAANRNAYSDLGHAEGLGTRMGHAKPVKGKGEKQDLGSRMLGHKAIKNDTGVKSAPARMHGSK